MLKIIVFPGKETIVTTDRQVMQVHPSFTDKGERLQDCKGLENVSDVEIRAIRWFLPFHALRLKLTPEIKKGVVKFLHQYGAQQNLKFDCYSFARLVCGVDPRFGSMYWMKFWNIQPDRWMKKVGDVVFLINREKQLFHHAAIYIGFGLYISVYGGGGDLEIATLKDMQRDYRAKDVVLVSPRN